MEPEKTRTVEIKYNETSDEIVSICCIIQGERTMFYSTLASVPYENVEAKYVMLRMIPDGGSIKGVGVKGKPFMGQFWESDGTTKGVKNYIMYSIEV